MTAPTFGVASVDDAAADIQLRRNHIIYVFSYFSSLLQPLTTLLLLRTAKYRSLINKLASKFVKRSLNRILRKTHVTSRHDQKAMS